MDGNWGEWGVWIICSKLCGGGEYLRKCLCNSFVVVYGGKKCEGVF